MTTTADFMLVALTFAMVAAIAKFSLRSYLMLAAEASRPLNLFDSDQEQLAVRNFQLAIELLRRAEYKEASQYLTAAEVALASCGGNNLKLASAILEKQSICLLQSSGDLNSAHASKQKARALALAEKSVLLAQMSKLDLSILNSSFTLATVHQVLGDYSLAELDIRACIRLSTLIYGENSPEEGRLYNNMGHLLVEQEKFQEALAAFNRAVMLLEFHSSDNSEMLLQARENQEKIWRLINL